MSIPRSFGRRWALTREDEPVLHSDHNGPSSCGAGGTTVLHAFFLVAYFR